MEQNNQPIEGGCTCGEIRYSITERPLFTHCCHCLWCQRESGSAFALNAMIEADKVKLLQGKPKAVALPTKSGRGQTMWRCPTCQVNLWSHYAGAGTKVNFIRVGTLDDPSQMPPDIHIYTASKQPWVILPEGALHKEGYYDPKQDWPEASLKRLAILRDQG
ncbi:MAG: aldehyde-activating protein [Robiginitomaculum sp.]|nr:MAG: aldehyde-activating protein [Robiginitomaculum sp.]